MALCQAKETAPHLPKRHVENSLQTGDLNASLAHGNKSSLSKVGIATELTSKTSHPGSASFFLCTTVQT